MRDRLPRLSPLDVIELAATRSNYPQPVPPLPPSRGTAYPDPEPRLPPRPPWHRLAACAGMSADLFFPAKSGSGKCDAREAKATCAACPVRATCLDEHLTEKFGVWGGMTERERRAEARRRRRQGAA